MFAVNGAIKHTVYCEFMQYDRACDKTMVFMCLPKVQGFL
jgi:hypothetical protein